MPIWIGEMSATKPLSTLAASALRGRIARHIAVRDSFADPLLRLRGWLTHDDLLAKVRIGAAILSHYLCGSTTPTLFTPLHAM